MKFFSLFKINYKKLIRLTLTRSDIVRKIEVKNMPPKPYKCKVRLPALSMRGTDTIVIITFLN